MAHIYTGLHGQRTGQILVKYIATIALLTPRTAPTPQKYCGKPPPTRYTHTRAEGFLLRWFVGHYCSAFVARRCQCPMTSTWFTDFYDSCLKGRPHMLDIVDFTQYYVGGKHGGPVTNSSWNSSFHGYGEVMGDRYSKPHSIIHLLKQNWCQTRHSIIHLLKQNWCQTRHSIIHLLKQNWCQTRYSIIHLLKQNWCQTRHKFTFDRTFI